MPDDELDGPPTARLGEAQPFAATVLAAGRGERLGGRAKSSLLIDGRSVLERLVDALREAGAVEVSVVIARDSAALRPFIDRCGAVAVPHIRQDADLVDSQRLAVHSHVERHPGHDLMLMPADLPLLQTESVRALCRAWAAREPQVLAQVPVVDGVRGHPVLLSWGAAQAIDAAPHRQGVREWLQAHAERTCRRPCRDPAHVFDLDTEEDVARFRDRIAPSHVRWP